MTVPVTWLHYSVPPDGLPLLQAWKALASDMYLIGYEGLREPLEARKKESANGIVARQVGGIRVL